MYMSIYIYIYIYIHIYIYYKILVIYIDNYKNLVYLCKRKEQNLKHHVFLKQIFVIYITSAKPVIQVANKVAS